LVAKQGQEMNVLLRILLSLHTRGRYESFDAVPFVDMKQMSDGKMSNETINLESTLFRKFKSFIKKFLGTGYRLMMDAFI